MSDSQTKLAASTRTASAAARGAAQERAARAYRMLAGALRQGWPQKGGVASFFEERPRPSPKSLGCAVQISSL